MHLKIMWFIDKSHATIFQAIQRKILLVSIQSSCGFYRSEFCICKHPHISFFKKKNL